ncbi:BMP family ABC transporter substrate-binding protein [Gynuella sunshinyii]|uniref:Putative ABC-type transport system, periplasmic component/surface lipoprotein n=1 Tax=Gynuella sunshinyii YC6258 TaxID=1445510 RepID=A0A0C5W2D6_9GAMM|nr:BMP family ABC transporter substrate-binding protein [Gynuella sunshinyii]AJQ96834.1 putative ABC-type transport system, periplasmic component/surface lipoprotein [Gynuella sunshinyii YC6258]
MIQLMSRWLLATVVALASAFSLADDPMKVGFVYIGPVGDHGWTYEHERGRKLMQEHFGDKVETTFVENVPEGQDAERVIRRLAQAGNKIIFTTSFGYMNPTAKVAKQFPNVYFEHATGYKRSNNMSTYVGRTYEGRWLSGTAAGMMTKTNVIGYIASFPIPEVIRDIDATYMAAKAVNPDVKIKIVWVSSWFDPPKEADAANTLIDQGVDVILQHTDSPAPVQVAERRGVKAVGQASDMSEFGPNAHMFSIVDNWAPHYIRTVEEVMNGTWKPEDYWGGFHDDLLTISSVNKNLPEDVVAKIAAELAKIESGELKPFTGPIKDNTGKVVVPAGHSLTDQELAAVNWYAEGIDDTIPQ